MRLNKWVHPSTGKPRHYLDDASALDILDITISRYGTGNIKHCTINGEKIANSRAGAIASLRVWFDDAGKAHIDNVSWSRIDFVLTEDRAIELLEAAYAKHMANPV